MAATSAVAATAAAMTLRPPLCCPAPPSSAECSDMIELPSSNNSCHARNLPSAQDTTSHQRAAEAVKTASTAGRRQQGRSRTAVTVAGKRSMGSPISPQRWWQHEVRS
eukprot:2782946-Rhodomonas_salina.1